jgi:hypothetical protein
LTGKIVRCVTNQTVHTHVMTSVKSWEAQLEDPR